MAPGKNPAGGGRKKAANGYQMPAPVPLGTVLTDMAKRQWKIGPSIGSGGFGEIYCACEANSGVRKTDDYPNVVKIEPHGNGPLFVEMHFYMRNAKLEDIVKFMKSRGLKHLGMPNFVGNGSHDLQNMKHRFLVMPRYSSDIWSIFLRNEKRFPLHTVYRIGLQMLDVLEYIHNCTYVHADLKGANILLGFGKAAKQKLFLVDFGLASHYTTKEFKPDPKKMHNGTIEYTSRDAHQGVPTMRGDMEILAYNVVQWTGTLLPWEAEKLLANPSKVQESKEKHMNDVGGFMKYCFKKQPCKPIHDYVKYVASLKYDEKPDYQKCRKMFETGLKELGQSISGDLEFETKPTSVAGSSRKKVVASADSTESSGPMARPRGRPAKVIQTSPDTTSPDPIIEPTKRKTETPSRPAQKKKKVVLANSPDPLEMSNGHRTSTPSSEVVSTQLSSMQQTGSIRLNTPGNKSGSTPKSSISNIKKIYAFNFELDVSIDAEVIVNVRRKKKEAASKPKETYTTQSPLFSGLPSTRKTPTPSPPKRPRRQNASYNNQTDATESIGVISLDSTEENVSTYNPDDETVPNSDPNTPEPRYNTSRSVLRRTPRLPGSSDREAAPLRRNNAEIIRAGEYKGKKAKS
ncbi:nucleosomal histone kinase 1 [Wyeomyia smithii]|uniref:nucleosomal histone kinase 1 n=1 Tax=Wyeomyia smithii TaxID=174621 RepID=UPI002467F4B4|nr:nucleosomal histone kinase 1 [Wyeomyia smithii]XP_055533678.1 nucleosomal histone kinase 1 [Wyeomyia smithii]XP_055533685.1 nucleosomal histone kinase 1 [Wyeomyia smithii]XP_055533691.1 nucleosomal histone kinase 1 [Wyeomyia smithii]